MSNFEEITKEMKALYERKNKDYGNSFSDTYERMVIISAVARIQDKTHRLVNLTTGRQQEVSDESVRDTLIDLANYAVMIIMEMDNRHED